MDRTYWCEFGQFLPGEKEVTQQRGVRLYDGDDRTEFDSGRVQFTTHRILWDDEEQEGRTLSLDISLILRTEAISSTFTRSAKIKLYLRPAAGNKASGPATVRRSDIIQLSFRKGGQEESHKLLRKQLEHKLWEKSPSDPGEGLKLRCGIVGIERGIQKRQRETDKQVNQAFKDLEALIEKAKDMILLVNKFATKIEEKKGVVSEDETAQFRSYLFSVGISNPVTRETHGTGSTYHRELAKELATFLHNTLQESGGIMTLVDVYCRFNRARGMELVSPDDVTNACKMFETLKQPMRMRMYDSGVLVVQSLAHSEENVMKETLEAVTKKGPLTAQDLSKITGISIALATERMLNTEKAGGICRDDSVEGLKFYANKFLLDASVSD